MASKSRKKRARRAILCTLAVCLLLTAAVVVWAHTPAADGLPRILYSHNVLLVRRSDGVVVRERNADERIYPASMTKIMTALLALEHNPDLQKTVTITEEMVELPRQYNAVQAGYLAGENVPVIDLVYGALLPSGAECCLALAQDVAGDEQSFAELMNERAAELGMTNTHFTNAIGLHDEQHYTTPRDLAVLLEAALQNPDFRTAFTSSRYSTGPTNLHPDGITVRSSLFEKTGSADFPGGQLLGGKTGYTDEAGLCLASLAEKNGVEYILITAGAGGSNRTAPHHVEDALAVFSSLN